MEHNDTYNEENYLFIVEYYDSDIEENERIQYLNDVHAKEHYNTIATQAGVENLQLIRLNRRTSEETVLMDT